MKNKHISLNYFDKSTLHDILSPRSLHTNSRMPNDTPGWREVQVLVDDLSDFCNPTFSILKTNETKALQAVVVLIATTS